MIASSAGTGLLILAAIYFVPAIVALVRKVPDKGSVVLLNVFLGWTVLFWGIALAMAIRSVPSRKFH